jgi:uncharacterized membrane protein
MDSRGRVLAFARLGMMTSGSALSGISTAVSCAIFLCRLLAGQGPSRVYDTHKPVSFTVAVFALALAVIVFAERVFGIRGIIRNATSASPPEC